jgi:hypothetical protein
MPGSAGQDDTGERMNLPCRREAEHHGRDPPAKFVFQILFSCCKSHCRFHTCECSASGIYFARQFRFTATVEQFLAIGEDVEKFRAFVSAAEANPGN